MEYLIGFAFGVVFAGAIAVLVIKNNRKSFDAYVKKAEGTIEMLKAKVK